MKRALAILLLFACHAAWGGQVTGLRAVHRGGQTLLTWLPVSISISAQRISGRTA